MDPSPTPVSPVSVHICGLTVGVRLSLIEKKTILEGVTADMPAGSLTAIIGGSGSGKTTLLNAISHRVSSKKLRVSGTTTFNGGACLDTVRSSYVMQEDVLLPALTVRETLQYAADLRLPPPSTEEERRAVVERAIMELGLGECAETRIGNDVHKGCNGGEKRRTSIGVQMLANPSVLFCEEPTIGLDAHGAFRVVQTLKKLAENGRTVIISIHAPTSGIWTLFDRVILLSRGATLYSGPAKDAVEHFGRCGHDLPAFVNPVEFLLDLAEIDTRSEEAEKASSTRVDQLRKAWERHSQPISGPITTPAVQNVEGGVHRQVGLRRQVGILTKRNTRAAIRDPAGIARSFIGLVGMSVIVGWIYFRLGEDLTGIRNREGALYAAPFLQNYQTLMFEIYHLTIDIKLFDREQNEGVVSVPAFLLSRRLSRLFLEDLPVPVIFGSIFYAMAGFRTEPVTFFIFLLIMVISQFIMVSLASLCVAVSRDFTKASSIGNIVLSLQIYCSGFFIQVDQIPIYVRWLKWIASNFYVYGALVANEFIGVHGGRFGQFYACPYSNDPADSACQEYMGRYIVDSMGFPSNWLWRPILVAVFFAIALSFGAGLLLTFRRVDIDAAYSRKTVKGTSRSEVTVSSSSREVRRAAIRLNQFGLEVKKRYLWGRSYCKTILNPITASFEPGHVNVIMGPCGSGGRTLLQGLAQRLDSTVFSKYRLSGKITLNNAVPSTDKLESISSYVARDDDALLPSLTVRETLHFAAGLRLPPSMSTKEKCQRAEDVILRMGLKDCADTLVGGELLKGISGGEKRRVSIAVQILTDPEILLLDEPTSGLDALTARSVIEVVNSLAEEGRTVIMTVHHARSRVLQNFHNVTLLARGGSVVYSGQLQHMLAHFKELGFECPQTTNPADFALGLITVDPQQEDRDEASHEKVQRMIRGWDASLRPLSIAAPQIAPPSELSSLSREMNPFRVTFPLVLKRSTINTVKNPTIMLMRITTVILTGITCALFFAPLQSNAESIRARMGFIQHCAGLYCLGVLQAIALYPMERNVFYSENAGGCYTTSTFLLSYTTLEVPFQILSSLMFGALASYGVGLRRTPSFFLITALNSFLALSCGESVGIVLCTLSPSHIYPQLNPAFTALAIASTMGGIMALNIPSFLQALNYLNPIGYQIGNMAVYAMRGNKFTCRPSQQVNGQCPLSTGEQVLKLYHLNKNADMYLIALGCMAVAHRIGAYLVVKVARTQWNRGVLGGIKGKQGGDGLVELENVVVTPTEGKQEENESAKPENAVEKLTAEGGVLEVKATTEAPSLLSETRH
ncbi:MAG: hypothetical protein M1840_002020 [Geoglossum simile]|nr:MAG: hypothetical protein M1840_002020 [Geoglossum simile]